MKVPRKPLPRPSTVSTQDTTAPQNIYKGGASSGQGPSGNPLVKLVRKALPINVAMFGQDLTGNKTPLTEKDLSSQELGVLRQAARTSKDRTITYDNYPGTGSLTDLKGSLTTPVGKMKTTVGGATLEGPASNTTLTDRYDFGQGGPRRKLRASDLNPFSSPWWKLHHLGEALGSEEGQGIPVNIKLGNLKRPTEQEETTMKYAKGTRGVNPLPKNGSYAGSTTPQLQGPPANQSQADLVEMGNQYANPGLALRKTVQGPSGGSYEDFQKNRHSPQAQAQKAALEQKLGVSRLSDQDYQQRVFDRGLGTLKTQANANPTQSVFTPEVRDAAYQQNRARDLSTGNRAQPTTKTVVDPGTLQDRAAQLTPTSTASAPGMPLQTPPSPMPIKRKPTSSPALAKYEEGTKGVKVNRKSTIAQDESRNEAMEPAVLSKPDNDGDLDQVVAENPSLKGNMTIPSIAPTNTSPSPGSGLVKGGTEAVAAYQRKLNSQGAKLTVDGAWGGKTQAAYDQFQGKPIAKPLSRKVSREVVSGPKGGDAPFVEQSAEGPMTSFLQRKGTTTPITSTPTPKPTVAPTSTTPVSTQPSLSNFLSTKGTKRTSFQEMARLNRKDQAVGQVMNQAIGKQKDAEDQETADLQRYRETGNVKAFNELVNKQVLRRKKG